MSPNLTGALLMMAAMACYTINDTFIKATGGELPLFQLLFLRGLLATTFIAVLAHLRGALRSKINAQDWFFVALRSLMEVAAAYFFLTALFNMPLANVTAILQVLPLTVTLGSALFFGDPVGWRRLTAIAVGFGGMLLIVRPGTDGFTIWSVYALIAVVCVTARDLTTRKISRNVPSLAVTLMSSLMILIASGLASLTETWAPVTGNLGLLIVGASVFIVGGYFFSVQVMRTGDISYIAPFRYTGLLWALLLGWVVFGDWPSNLTLIGAGIIVATGIFTLYREQKLRRVRSKTPVK